MDHFPLLTHPTNELLRLALHHRRHSGIELEVGEDFVTWNAAGETKQVRGVKHVINNAQGTRQEQHQQTGNANKKLLMQKAGNRAGEQTNIGEVINR